MTMSSCCVYSFKTPDGSIVTYGTIVFVRIHCLLFVIVRKVLDNHEKHNRLYCSCARCKQTTVIVLLDLELYLLYVITKQPDNLDGSGHHCITIFCIKALKIREM